jgi:phenylacetic acid degradation operon negative regulatory protein
VVVRQKVSVCFDRVDGQGQHTGDSRRKAPDTVQQETQVQTGWLQRINAGAVLRAGHFIVTLYGDVVEPRGGRLWIGNIIETCAEVGISETLVRTAVSRLVRAGKLKGQREGRRSYYALTAAARAEFAQAARILFDPPKREGWSFVHGAAELPAPFVRVGEGWWFGPHSALPAGSGVVFEAQQAPGSTGLPAMAHGLFALEALEQAYNAFLERFEALAQASSAVLPPSEALMLRLLLVDLYRAIALKDPLLPAEALPQDWAGREARSVFCRLYSRFSPAADSYVASSFVSAGGALPCSTATTLQRAQTLAASG